MPACHEQNAESRLAPSIGHSLIEDWINVKFCIHLHLKFRNRIFDFDMDEYCANFKPPLEGLLLDYYGGPGHYRSLYLGNFQACEGDRKGLTLVPVIDAGDCEKQFRLGKLPAVVGLMPLKRCERLSDIARSVSYDQAKISRVWSDFGNPCNEIPFIVTIFDESIEVCVEKSIRQVLCSISARSSYSVPA